MMTNVTMPIRIAAVMILPHGHLRFEGAASVCESLLLLWGIVSAVE